MTGKVIKTSGALALVEQSEKESPCDMCKSPCVQKNCKKTKKISLWADNSVSADIGDTVETEEKKNSLTLICGALCFVFPIVVSVICFVLTGGFSEGYRILSSFISFVLCEAICAVICSAVSKRVPTLVITAITRSKEQINKNGE